MLDAVLLILKIIGFVLLVILALLVFLVCMILFNSIKYGIKAKYDGTLESLAAKLNFSWLFHLIEGEVLIKQDVIRWKVHIAWVKLSGQPESAETVEHEVEQEAEKVGEEVGEFVEEEAEEFAEEMEEEPDRIREELHETEEKAEEVAQETYSDIKRTVDTVESREAAKKQAGEEDQEAWGGSAAAESSETYGQEAQTGPSDTDQNHPEKNPGIFRFLGGIFKTVIDAVRGVLIGIRETILTFIEWVKQQEAAADMILDFIRADTHVNAVKKIAHEAVQLLKKIMPGLKSLKLKYGFDDPCLTGEVLAGLSILYPFLGDKAMICPDFEKQVLRGNIDMDGKIRLWHIVRAAVVLLLDKNIRQTYTDLNAMMNA